MCPEQDSNLHAVKHTHLKRARLPIPPPGQQLVLFRMLSGKRDSNSRPQPWQGCALPTELFPHYLYKRGISPNAFAKVISFSDVANFSLSFFLRSPPTQPLECKRKGSKQQKADCPNSIFIKQAQASQHNAG